MNRGRQHDSPRTGLRKEEQHASWREVYYALDVDPDAHACHRDGREGPVVLKEVGE